LKYQNELKDY